MRALFWADGHGGRHRDRAPEKSDRVWNTWLAGASRLPRDRIGDLDRLNQRLHRRLVRGNVYMPSTTRVHGHLALRPCFVGALAEEDQVDGLLQEVLRLGAELAEEGEGY